MENIVLFFCLLFCGVPSAGSICTDDGNFTTTYQDIFFHSCEELATNVDVGPWLCLVFGWDGMECCASCETIYGDINTNELKDQPSECKEEVFQMNIPSGVTIRCSNMTQVPYSYYCRDFSQVCCQSCKNFDITCQDVPWEVNVRSELMSCSKMASTYHLLCSPQHFGHDCCVSCRNIDYNAPCLLNPLMYWPISTGELIYCEDYVRYEPSRCQESDVMEYCCPICEQEARCTDSRSISVTLENNDYITECEKLAAFYPNQCTSDRYGGEGNLCCHSCRGIDTSCTDSAMFFIAPSGEPVTSCQLLASDYTYYCLPEQYGGKGNKCCQSCKNVDMSCVDDPSNHYINEFGIPVYCREGVKQNIVMCASQGCCKSCKRLLECNDEDYVTLNLPNHPEVTEVSCFVIAHHYPYYCTQPDYIGGLGKCCVSCKDLDTSCVDNPEYSFREDNTTYYCEDLTSNITTTQMCNNIEVRGNCCKACNTRLESTLITSLPQNISASTFMLEFATPASDYDNMTYNSNSSLKSDQENITTQSMHNISESNSAFENESSGVNITDILAASTPLPAVNDVTNSNIYSSQNVSTPKPDENYDQLSNESAAAATKSPQLNNTKSAAHILHSVHFLLVFTFLFNLLKA